MSEPTPNDPPQEAASGLVQTIYARRGVLTAFGLLAGLGLGANALWRQVGPTIAKNERYLVTPATVTVSQPPAWVTRPLVDEAFQRSGLAGSLSILDPPEKLEQPLAAAIEADPWVRSVGPITKSPPNEVALQVEYRRPLAAVVLGHDLLPIDADAALLPRGDLPSDQVRWMPRIELERPDARPPREGQVWAEPRVAGAAAIVEAFGPHWVELDLFALRADATPDVRAGRRFWNYKIRSTGDTTILWGAAPGHGPPDEADFTTKLNRLRRFVAKHGRLDSVEKSPELLDVRDGVAAFERVVLRQGKRVASRPGDDSAPIR